jgi:hypothetical protein
MIITIFILILIGKLGLTLLVYELGLALGRPLSRVLKLWLWPFFFFYWLGSTRVYPLNPWSRPCTNLTFKLGFKTMIITIFIFTWLDLIILKLRDFYNNILGMKNNKYFLLRLVPFVPPVLEVQRFTPKLFWKQIYFYISVYLFNQIYFYLYYLHLFCPWQSILDISITRLRTLQCD